MQTIFVHLFVNHFKTGNCNTAQNIMVRHFAKKKEALKFQEEHNSSGGLHIWKKHKGHRNRIQKPFVVCTEFEWLNLN